MGVLTMLPQESSRFFSANALMQAMQNNAANSPDAITSANTVSDVNDEITQRAKESPQCPAVRATANSAEKRNVEL